MFSHRASLRPNTHIRRPVRNRIATLAYVVKGMRSNQSFVRALAKRASPWGLSPNRDRPPGKQQAFGVPRSRTSSHRRDNPAKPLAGGSKTAPARRVVREGRIAGRVVVSIEREFEPMTHPAFAPARTAVVTGGASGIGLAAAELFAALGLKVCIADLEGERLHAAAEELFPPPPPAGRGRTSSPCRPTSAGSTTCGGSR